MSAAGIRQTLFREVLMDVRRHRRLSLQACLWSGLSSALALALASRVRGDRPPTSINGPSHWFFGEKAVHDQRLNLRHTVVGMLVHQASSLFWSSLFAGARLGLAARGHQSWRCISTEAAAWGAMAALVDLAVMPRRLSPGFERRLSAPHLAAVYGSFAAGLAIAAWREAAHADKLARAASSTLPTIPEANGDRSEPR